MKRTKAIQPEPFPKAVVVFLMCVTPIATGTAYSASIYGRVVDALGEPVSNANVHYHQFAEFRKDASGKVVQVSPGHAGVVKVGSDGSFRADALSAGTYQICAVGTEGQHMSGCAWEPVPSVPLTADQTIEVKPLKLYRVGTLAIRVIDSRDSIILPDRFGNISTPERRFFVGVVGPSGAYQAARLARVAAGEKTYEVNVPEEQEVQLFVDSGLRIRGVTGELVTSGARSLKAVTSAERLTEIVLRVD